MRLKDFRPGMEIHEKSTKKIFTICTINEEIGTLLDNDTLNKFEYSLRTLVTFIKQGRITVNLPPTNMKITCTRKIQKEEL